MSPAELRHLLAYLWPDGDSPKGPQVHMLVDGACDPAIEPMLRFGKLEYNCLFGGKLSPRLRAAAPYLVHLAPDSPLSRELLTRGWHRHWGVLTVAPPDVTITQQRLHFKKFLRVRDEAGAELAFRFYDPRVLRIYLPSCTADESQRFFGRVSRMLMPSEAPGESLDYASRPHGPALRRTNAPLDGMEQLDQARSVMADLRRESALAEAGEAAAALQLVPLDAQHAEGYFALQNDAEVLSLTRLPRHASADDARRWIASQAAIAGKTTLALLHPEHGLIGAVALRGGAGAALFYYWIGEPYRRRGFGRAALGMLMAYARGQGIGRLYSPVYESNQRSIDLLLRCGFQAVPGVLEATAQPAPCYWVALHGAAQQAPVPVLRAQLQHLLQAAGSGLLDRAAAVEEAPR